MFKITNKRELAQTAVGYLVDYGVGLIVLAGVKQFVPTPKLWQKVGLSVACFAIGGVISKKAKVYTDDAVNDIFDTFDEIRLQVSSRQD